MPQLKTQPVDVLHVQLQQLYTWLQITKMNVDPSYYTSAPTEKDEF